MVLNIGRHSASEDRSVEECLKLYPNEKKNAIKFLGKIKPFFNVGPNSRILELGSAQGLFLAAMSEMGFDCNGIEPSEKALATSQLISKKLKTKIKSSRGFGEKIPFQDNSFNIVVAFSVMEHVNNVEKVFSEVHRVLKKQGIFYFYTASSLCPSQGEIRFFPFFSWYPDRLKVSIMKWAVKNKASWVGHTSTPAINWFTPWKARRLLSKAGFSEIYDRWDIRKSQKQGLLKKNIFGIIGSNNLLKILADFFIPDCAYLAKK